ncbi:MAG: hypothetical protein WCI74_17340 [Actinomycetes bacterium]
MAGAVIAVAGMNLFMPTTYQITEVGHLLYPGLMLVLLLILLVGELGRADGERRWSRVLSGVLIGVITLVALASAARVLLVILTDPEAIVSVELLRVAVVLWLTVNIAFALWYSYLDCGGPTMRARGGTDLRPAFIFPEYGLDRWGYTDWYPQFPDYLVLSFNASMALGPSDVSAVRHWAKFSMLIQALFSLCMLYIVLTQAISTL